MFTLPAAVLPGTGTWAPDSDLPPPLPAVDVDPFPRVAPPPGAPPLLGAEPSAPVPRARKAVPRAPAADRPSARGCAAALRLARPLSASAGRRSPEPAGSAPAMCGAPSPCPQPARSWDLGLFSANRLLISPLALPNKKVLFNRVNFEYREKASVVNYSVVSKAFVALRQTEGETQG